MAINIHDVYHTINMTYAKFILGQHSQPCKCLECAIARHVVKEYSDSPGGLTVTS